MKINETIELIDTFKAIAKFNNEFKQSLNINDFVEALFIEGLIEIEEIDLICDCIKFIENLQGNLKLEDIKLICNRLLSRDKVKANITFIDICLMCEYLKIAEKILSNIDIENIDLKVLLLKTKEKINSLIILDDINLTIKEILLLRWIYVHEIETHLLSDIENFNVSDKEGLLL